MPCDSSFSACTCTAQTVKTFDIYCIWLSGSKHLYRMLQFLSVKVDILTSLNHLISHFTNVIMLLLFGYCSLVSLIIWKYFNVTDLSEIILRTHSNRSRFLLKTQVYIHRVAKVYSVLPFYDVKCLCSGGWEWGREESHSHKHFNIWFLWYKGLVVWIW